MGPNLEDGDTCQQLTSAVWKEMMPGELMWEKALDSTLVDREVEDEPS